MPYNYFNCCRKAQSIQSNAFITIILLIISIISIILLPINLDSSISYTFATSSSSDDDDKSESGDGNEESDQDGRGGEGGVEGTEETGEENNESEGAAVSLSEGSGDEQDTDTDNEVSNEASNTEAAEVLDQETACPGATIDGPTFVDETDCTVPCPPIPVDNSQDASIPEGCPIPVVVENPPDTQSQEEQLKTLGANLDDAPRDVGESKEICEDGKDNDGDGDLDEHDCMMSSLIDSDGDGVPDSKEDADGDRIIDSKDNCPAKANSNQADSNGNGIGDLCDTNMRDQDFVDSDNDFSYNIRDNCPDTFNPDQKDVDKDGIGDQCDLSIDASGNTIGGDDTVEYGGGTGRPSSDVIVK